MLKKAFAITSDIGQVIDDQKGSFFKFSDIGQMVTRLIPVALSVGAVMTLAYLIWGGIDLIVSQGDKQNNESARDKMTYAIIGLAILASVWAGWHLLLKFMGIGELGDTKVEFSIPTPGL